MSDVKISALSAATSAASADVFPFVVVAGTPTTKKITLANLDASLPTIATTRAANLVWCGPATGSAAAPTFRALVAADIPALGYSTFSGAYGDLSGKPDLSVAAITSGTINGTDIGTNTQGTGAFTTLSANSIERASGALEINALGGSIRLYAAEGFVNCRVSLAIGADSPDVFLVRAAANTLAIRNGANAQTFETYGTYTDGSNYEKAILQWSSGTLYIGTAHAGSGSPCPIDFVVANSSRWKMSVSGHFLAATDNTYDIGSPTNAPKDIYAAGSFIGDGSQVTDVAGTLTVDTGWTANADDGDATANLPAIGDPAALLGTFYGDYSTAANMLITVIQQLKALRAALRDHLSPNN